MPLPEVARLPDEEAALSGDANAMYCLAGRYERGDGVAQNTAIALSWYGRAADSGIFDAVPKVIALREQLSRKDALSRAVAAEHSPNRAPATPPRAPTAIPAPAQPLRRSSRARRRQSRRPNRWSLRRHRPRL